jgi:hypothetical protein
MRLSLVKFGMEKLLKCQRKVLLVDDGLLFVGYLLGGSNLLVPYFEQMVVMRYAASGYYVICWH